MNSNISLFIVHFVSFLLVICFVNFSYTCETPDHSSNCDHRAHESRSSGSHNLLCVAQEEKRHR